MTDPRITPPPMHVVLNEAACIGVPVAELKRSADGPRDRQLVYGDPVTVLNRVSGHCLIRSEKDGYCGYVDATSCRAPTTPTHRVTARSTHAYSNADFKSEDLIALPFGAQLAATSETPTFVKTELGYVPRQHLHRADALAEDPSSVAALFLGTPYLWGGNSHLGIDCSGLVQAACLACGISCPGDSDLQETHLGAVLPPNTPLQRNDLIFWKGHVALVTDEKTLIHANAGHMAVVYEPIEDALRRIETQGDGTPTSRKRLTLP
jgi:cell wall-associated NlpC family hydrolase